MAGLYFVDKGEKGTVMVGWTKGREYKRFMCSCYGWGRECQGERMQKIYVL